MPRLLEHCNYISFLLKYFSITFSNNVTLITFQMTRMNRTGICVIISTLLFNPTFLIDSAVDVVLCQQMCLKNSYEMTDCEYCTMLQHNDQKALFTHNWISGIGNDQLKLHPKASDSRRTTRQKSNFIRIGKGSENWEINNFLERLGRQKVDESEPRKANKFVRIGKSSKEGKDVMNIKRHQTINANQSEEIKQLKQVGRQMKHLVNLNCCELQCHCDPHQHSEDDKSLEKSVEKRNNKFVRIGKLLESSKENNCLE